MDQLSREQLKLIISTLKEERDRKKDTKDDAKEEMIEGKEEPSVQLHDGAKEEDDVFEEDEVIKNKAR